MQMTYTPIKYRSSINAGEGALGHRFGDLPLSAQSGPTLFRAVYAGCYHMTFPIELPSTPSLLSLLYNLHPMPPRFSSIFKSACRIDIYRSIGSCAPFSTSATIMAPNKAALDFIDFLNASPTRELPSEPSRCLCTLSPTYIF